MIVAVGSKSDNDNWIRANIGGAWTLMYIDSRAGCNIIDKRTWESLKREKVQCKFYLTKKSVFVYGENNIIGHIRSVLNEVNN